MATLPWHDQCVSKTCFANTQHLPGAGPSLGTLSMTPIPCPEGCATQCPLQGHRGAAQAMTVADSAGPPRARLMEGTGTHPTCCPRVPLPHTHTHWSCTTLTLIYSSIATHAVTKQEGPHAGVSQSGCPHTSPLTHRESPTCRSAEPRASPGQLQPPVHGLLRARPQARRHDKSGETLYQPQIHPLPFQIWSAAHRESHPSLVSPWAQFTLAASTRMRDRA